MNLFIPKVRVEDRKYPKWFNSKIIHTIKCLRTLRRKCLLYPTHNNSSKLLSLESHLTSLMNSVKLDFENNLSTQNSSNIFKYIKSQLALCHLFSVWTPRLSSSDNDKECLFNTFFHSVFTRSSFQIPPLEKLATPLSTLSDIGISELDVFDALSSLDSSKAMGIDEVGPKILKHCALALYKPIHHLFLLSLSQHYLPNDWRTHLIITVFKSGDKSSVRNYRPPYFAQYLRSCKS